MSKAVLVLDIPSRCKNCPLCYEDYGCYITGKYHDKPLSNSCPLKALPEKEYGADLFDEYETGWEHGWNRCIDKILGENNNEEFTY